MVLKQVLLITVGGKGIKAEDIDKFLSTEFEGGRHIKRIDKLSNPPLL